MVLQLLPDPKPHTAGKIKGRHPLLKDRPKGVWYPDAVNVVPGYPKSQEAFQKRVESCRAQVIKLNAAGVTNRKGVPNGWHGRKTELAQARQLAIEDSIRIYRRMVDDGHIAVIPGTDGERAEQAMINVIRISIDMTEPTAMRHQASRTVLEYYKSKPSAKSEVTVARAEDFLTALIGK